MKKLVRKIKFPLSIIVGVLVTVALFAYPFESYTLPIIIIWMPDVIGWDAFFVFLGILAGLITFLLCLGIGEEEN